MPTLSPELRKLYEEHLIRVYRKNPVVYINQMLNRELTPDQSRIVESLIRRKRTFVKASHSVGKTMLAGGLVNWFFDCFDPSITLTTAPTKEQVDDLLWKEVRIQRAGRPGLLPKASRLESAENHFAVGYTARDDKAFQGRHEERVLIIFDEATGIDSKFWDAAEGMLTGENCYFLAILNPTDTASRAYIEEQSGNWDVITVSALNHPNIIAELRGEPPPFPAAVRLSWVNDKIQKWCTPILKSDKSATDLEWPPNSGKWHRPGPLFEGRVLGRWPTNSTTSVWSEGLWEASLVEQSLEELPTEIGCDVARFGDDYTSIFVRRGNCALHHETHNGWDTSQTAGRLKQLAKKFAQKGEEPQKIQVKVDDDGVGGGVVDQKDGFGFIAVNSGSKPNQPEDYPNRRSELWFSVAQRANEGLLDLSRLSSESKSLLRTQLMAPTWKVDSQGRRVVEPKDMTKKRIGRSPDDADAMNLAFCVKVRKRVGFW